jgi:hypothetical protein
VFAPPLTRQFFPSGIGGSAGQASPRQAPLQRRAGESRILSMLHPSRSARLRPPEYLKSGRNTFSPVRPASMSPRNWSARAPDKIRGAAVMKLSNRRARDLAALIDPELPPVVP